MAETPEEQQALLVTEIGDTSDNLLSNNVARYWARRANKALVSPTLQLLFVRKDLILLAMGAVRNQVNFRAEGDVSYDASDRMAHLLQMLEAVKDDIAAELTVPTPVIQGSTTQVAAGELTTTSSTNMLRPYGSPNANSLRYRGSPYQPCRPRRP